MNVERIVPHLTVADLPQAVREYTATLGLEVVMDHGWIVTLADTDGRQLSLLTRDGTASVNPAVSIFVDDVVAAFEAATAAGLDIVHPLTGRIWESRGSSTAIPTAMS